ncbi:hypothetical protein PybrP1_011986 [[Pythium] brassicae (nom. inval.)]|nr:hypothetical protein PybrP1_011986 [[Pythium] brassicae (nom. inval.)]
MSALRNERLDDSAATAWTPSEPAPTPLPMTLVPPPPPPLSAYKRSRKVTPALGPEDESEDEDGEVDETFLALQKLLMNLEGMRLSQVAPPVGGHQQSPQVGMGAAATGAQPQRPTSREEILESRRREREQYRLLLLSKAPRSATSGGSSSRRRRPAYYYCIDDDEDEDEGRAPSVESTISNRMMNGSFSRYSVHAISRERWAREEAERLPIVLLPKNGRVSSPADNPRLNVMHTAEYIDLSEQLEAKLQDELQSRMCYLTPPRSTWCIQMRDFEALQC